MRPDGRKWDYRAPTAGTVYLAASNISDKLTRLVDGSNNITGWTLVSADGDRLESYDAVGKLLSITDRNGRAQILTYSDITTPSTVAPRIGLLIRVTNTYGQQLNFTYDANWRVQKFIDPAGQETSFAYDANNNLVSITYPGGPVRTYYYGEAAYTGGVSLPNHLTGIADENGVRFAIYQYDTQGRAVSTEHANGVERYAFTYNSDGTTLVTDPINTARTYNFQTVLGVVKNTANTQPCVNCSARYQSQSYDANGNIASRTDWNGNRTNYSYDLARNLETSRMEGLTSAGGTTPSTRKISTQWHATYRLPTGIAEPFRITTMVYGDPSDTNPGNRGSLLSRTIQATTDATGAAGFGATPTGTPRTWSYTYNANGSVLTMNGPRTDVADVTTYTYYANNATCSGASAVGCRGQVESITNAAGHLTQITDYNAHGQPFTIVDPNGLTTTLAYDLRQRLTSRSVGGELTSYTYDNAGQFTRVTLPDGSFLSYTYDAAHRLTQIDDNLGNRINYTLDLMGNRTLEEMRDPANQLAQTRSRVYSNLNRLSQEIGAQGQTTAYAYDNQGNLTSINGPLTGNVDVTTNAYDALNRLIRVTDPNAGQVNYGYNGLDQLTSVSDPRTLVTTYSYNGLNNLNQQVSPDTGTTVNTYDDAGNLLTQTDAKGQVTSYAYDALNRVTSITYQGGVVHSYQYDQGTNGKGRLTQITEPNSTTQYVYDQKGRLTTETRTINAVPYVTAYAYDSSGRMTGITYPSGREVAYTLDSLGRVSQIATTKNGVTQPVVSSVSYRPFGPAQGLTFGNGQTYTRGFDTDGRVASYTLGTQSFAVGYDAASRVSFISDTVVPANTNTYTYDNLDRLTNAVAPGTPYAYTYDTVGNRLAKTVGAATDTYAYSGTSNRLATITPATGSVKNIVFDANGSTTNDAINQYTYDTRGRLVQANTVLGAVQYQVNSLGQRIRKTGAPGDTVFHYDAQGRLIAETSAAGAIQKEYIYLGDIPVAVCSKC